MIDINNLTFIKESEVPKRIRTSKWREIFEAIPKGEALVIKEQPTANQALSALYGYHRRDKYINLKGVLRQKTAYIINQTTQ